MGLPDLPFFSAALYSVVFIAAVLVTNQLFNYQRDVRGARKRVNERLEMMARGMKREEIMSQLRRKRKSDRSGILGWLGDKLHLAGIRTAPGRFLTGQCIVAAFVAVVFPVTAGLIGRFPTLATMFFVGILAGAVGFVFPIFYLNRRGVKRLKKFEGQFPVALDIFIRGLRAGHPVSAALDLLTTEMPDPIGSEFGLVTDEVNYGLSLKEALENLASRVPTQDISMFVVCVGIQSETGGNLAEILEGLSKVIRERASMVLKVRALASEGKMSGIMLSILPVFTFCLVFINSPSFYLDVADDPIFWPAIAGILVIYATGVTVMKKLTDLKV